MSGRGLIPVALAVGLGIANGYIVFNPAFQEREVEKIRKQQEIAGSDLGPNLIEVPVSTIEPDKQRDAMQQKEISSSQTPSVQAANTESKKSRWWPF